MPDLITASCFSFQFYIKPQHAPLTDDAGLCCFSFQFYIKPQRFVSFLSLLPGCFSFQFYIKPQHPGTPNEIANSCFSFQFYIKPQLANCFLRFREGCFSFQFYIKPQRGSSRFRSINVVSHSNSTSNHNAYELNVLRHAVVSHSNSTSNHNYGGGYLLSNKVVSHSNSTSNHNTLFGRNITPQLFLIPILHQTTTSRMAVIHILHVTHMTPMHKTSCRTPGKLVGCNFVFQRAIYQKNSSC